MIKKLLVVSMVAAGLLMAPGADAVGFGSNKDSKKRPYTPPLPPGRVAVPELSAGPSAGSALALLAGGLLVVAGRRRRQGA
jgi:hypothetical protein